MKQTFPSLPLNPESLITRESKMTIRKKFLSALLIAICGAGYVALLVKLSNFPIAKASHCMQYAYSCYTPPVRLWP